MMTRPATTHIRCPKCRSRNLVFIETSTWETTWDVTEGKFDLDDRLGNPSHIERIEAECRECKHGWKPRNAWQVDDVCTEIEEETDQ
ncbi:hypothetical protein GOB33_22400 [Sinorhizobium meliloti]|nr:hypothetical protein [Sinorhizobium meliloti]